MKPEFTREQGLKLCRLARQALENELLGTRHDLQNLNEPAFGVERGCFVTLWTAKKELRGCIGNLEPLDDQDARDRLVEAVATLPRAVGVRGSLGELGMRSEDVGELARNAMLDACLVTNPKSPDRSDIEKIYEQAL